MASGIGAVANSGTVTTSSANALIFGVDITSGRFSTAGTNCTTPVGDVAEDGFVTAAGGYNATTPLTAASAAWIMRVAAFKAASGSTIV